MPREMMPEKPDPLDLNQTEADELTKHLAESAITRRNVFRVLRRLDSLDCPPGEVPDGWTPTCKKCGERMDDDEEMGVAGGGFYHANCVPNVTEQAKATKWVEMNTGEQFAPGK